MSDWPEREQPESAEDRRDRLKGLKQLRPDMYARLVGMGDIEDGEEERDAVD